MASPIASAFAGPPRRNSSLVRYLLVAIILLFFVWWYRISSRPAQLQGLLSDSPKQAPITVPGSTPPSSSRPPPQSTIEEAYGSHPIDILIEAGEGEFDGLLSKQTHDVNAAAAAYRERRGRHPPPGFEAWFDFAKENGAIVVEDFWDQIYHDLGPFWGLPAHQIRRDAKDYEMTINVRNGKASAGSDWFWTKIWLNLTQTIESYLPDMDLALNAMDEPRLVVPWEDIDRYMEAERASRHMAPPDEVISEYGGLTGPEQDSMPASEKAWEDTRTSASGRVIQRH